MRMKLDGQKTIWMDGRMQKVKNEETEEIKEGT